jgi:SAM-dependent methyltransferase
MNFRERLLAKPGVYRTFKRIVLPPGVLDSLVSGHYVVPDGGSVLDLGCGFGDYAPFFSSRATYVGIDHNPEYVATARSLHGNANATFVAADVTDPEVAKHGPFDLIMISGVLHHLDDAAVTHLAANIVPLLKPGGKFVALEAVFDPDQGLLARLIIASDRGRFVRDATGYRRLLEGAFDQVTSTTVNGMLRIPYTHLIISAERSAAADN